MSLEWQARSGSLAWSNPVAVWWGLLTAVSAVNIAVWFVMYRWLLEQPASGIASKSSIELMLLLCAGYVFGCAFRSFRCSSIFRRGTPFFIQSGAGAPFR